jgi:hypothetical protein
MEENSDKHSGETSSAECEASLGKELSKFHTDLDLTKGSDKENVDINLNSQLNSEQSSVNTKSRELSEKQSNTEFKDNGSCSIQTSQSDCKNIMTKQETDQSGRKNAMTKQNGKKSNWLRDMGVKKNKVSRKIKLPSQPSSPQLQEPSSPNTVSVRLFCGKHRVYVLGKAFIHQIEAVGDVSLKIQTDLRRFERRPLVSIFQTFVSRTYPAAV